MLLCRKTDFARYAILHPRLEALARLLDTQDFAALPEGRHDLLGDDLYVVCAPQAVTRPSALLEAHRCYVDVQWVVGGTEEMGWAPLASLSTEDAPYDAERDIVFFRDPPLSVYRVTAGCLAVFFPEDAHAPLLGDGHRVHKCVFKVRLDSAAGP
ncbi:MAG: YhcH/YjgK/YiaL family protein [Polyangiaceae bacterium]|nr:YhcH/YjgK/YiaL family protein [Polyangiaceae bacterium]